jgi:hypothetical protein
MQYRIVSSSEVRAAGFNLSPACYLADPCGNCEHGKGQHHPLLSVHYKLRRNDTTACTACKCPGYEPAQQFYGS